MDATPVHSELGGACVYVFNHSRVGSGQIHWDVLDLLRVYLLAFPVIVVQWMRRNHLKRIFRLAETCECEMGGSRRQVSLERINSVDLAWSMPGDTFAKHDCVKDLVASSKDEKQHTCKPPDNQLAEERRRRAPPATYLVLIHVGESLPRRNGLERRMVEA